MQHSYTIIRTVTINEIHWAAISNRTTKVKSSPSCVFTSTHIRATVYYHNHQTHTPPTTSGGALSESSFLSALLPTNIVIFLTNSWNRIYKMSDAKQSISDGHSKNSTQLNEHVRTQVLTPQCSHLFNTTTYETTHLLLHVLIYLQFRSGRLCNHTFQNVQFDPIDEDEP